VMHDKSERNFWRQKERKTVGRVVVVWEGRRNSSGLAHGARCDLQRRRKGMQRNGRASRRSETPARAWNAPG